MAKLNVSQAATLAGKSRPTLYKHIKSGKVSAEKTPDGYRFDPAELERVYGPLRSPDTVKIDTSLRPDLTVENARLVAEVELLQQRLADKEEIITELKADKGRLFDELREQRALLQARPEPGRLFAIFRRRKGG